MSSESLTRTVTTQEGLDQALADQVGEVVIASPCGVWLELSQSGSATVRASGSATVRAYGSATVRAYGSATVRAYGSATVSAYDSATVRASGSATVSAYDSATVRASGSATVSAYDSATVRASGSATVSAYDSATVRAYGSATVHAYDSATVHAYDSATVRASDSATVSAYDSATVHASKYVAIHLHSQRVALTGDGHVIDVTRLNLTAPNDWCDYRGVDVNDGVAYVYKAVGDDWTSTNRSPDGSAVSYTPGSTPEAADWNTTQSCGGGLHFSPSPHHALAYRPDATKFLRCGVRLDEMVTLDDKVKVRRVVVPCVEVDVHGREVVSA